MDPATPKGVEVDNVPYFGGEPGEKRALFLRIYLCLFILILVLALVLVLVVDLLISIVANRCE